MTNIILILWIVFIFLLIVLAVVNTHTSKSVFPFLEYKNTCAPIIDINVQGHVFRMMVDSGAAVSIITKQALDQLKYEPSPRHVDLLAMTGEDVPHNVVTIPITINGKEIKTDFLIHDTEDFCNYSNLYGFPLYGILGDEFLQKVGGSIDYKKHTVTLV